MKRRNLFGGLLAALGVARAQQWNEPIIKDGLCVGDSKGNCTHKTALNNQCPVCGTMAESFIQEYQSYGVMTCESANDLKDPYLVVCDPPKKYPKFDSPRITRCKRCNAAFWQDAEEPKK